MPKNLADCTLHYFYCGPSSLKQQIQIECIDANENNEFNIYNTNVYHMLDVGNIKKLKICLMRQIKDLSKRTYQRFCGLCHS